MRDNFWLDSWQVAYNDDDEDRLSQYFRSLYTENTPVNIQVPISEIKSGHPTSLISCKAFMGRSIIDCAVACGNWHKVQFTSEELKLGAVNLLDHFSELLPNTMRSIGLVTYQNGIMNLPEDFKKMGETILKSLPKVPLCIGIYNRTYGLTGDVDRLFDTLKGYESESVCFTHLIFGTMAKLLPRINSSLLWHHIAHSEGGLIASLAIEGHRIQQEEYIRTHLISTTYGPVAPIPKSKAHIAWNTYSEDDRAALRFGKRRVNHPDYEISIVPSLVPKEKQPPVEGDHAFQGATYQRALSENIKDLRNKYAIHYA